MTAEPEIASSLIPSESDLDATTEPGSRIVLACQRAKQWLTHALESNDIEQIVEMKCQAEAIRVYTMQKELGKDAELAAAEIVRRAERCIGLAIRKGQEEGRIRKQGQSGKNLGTTQNIRSVSEFARYEDLSGDGHRPGFYDLADGIPDEQFESALDSAKEQRNLSRANVVRNLKGEANGDRWKDFEELAASGLTSYQIADKLGVTRQRVAAKARQLGITIQADVALGRSSKKVDHNRILADIVDTLDALRPSCELVKLARVERDLLIRSLHVLDDAMPALSRLRKALRKELSDES